MTRIADVNPVLDTLQRIKDMLAHIEAGKVTAYEGFKQVRWRADVYMMWEETTAPVPRPPAGKQEPAAAGSKSPTETAVSKR